MTKDAHLKDKTKHHESQSSNEEKNVDEVDSKKETQDEMITIKASEYNKIVAEVAEYKDKYLRLFAEFDNARKRMERDRIEFIKYANEDVLLDFLGVVDNLELSLQSAKQKEDQNALIKGLEMVVNQAKDVLKKNGVVHIEAKGKPFDPHVHEILLQEENDEHEDGTVLEEFQKGYRLGEKVIRTVKVKVSTKKST
ncbi:MAG: nucleotide exchange factor GrpE [Candidatus Omnitrophica bacterium]|nr:nucleotide exchange factor GrpE [Candidatus Omnitrophota bacterium]